MHHGVTFPCYIPVNLIIFSLEPPVLKGLFSRSKKFEADHPFVFAIKHKDSIVFIGHIANYAYV